MKSMFLPLRTALSVVLLSLCAAALHADTLVLTNGDRLTGTALKLDGGKLSFKTAWADPIAIDWAQVTSLQTDKPLLLPVGGKLVSVTKVERTASGLVVTSDQGPSNMDSAQVAVLRSPADQAAYEASLHPGWGHAWAGAVNVSLALTRGNSQTATFGTGMAMARQTNNDKTALYANTVYSHDNKAQLTTANTAAGGAAYNHNLNPRIFAFGSADFADDQLQELDLRSILAGGFGWHAVKTPKQTFDVLGGLAWTHEHYSTIPGTPSTPAVTNSFAALDLGENYMRKIGAGSLLAEQMTFYPDLSHTGQYQFNLASTFSTKLGKLLSWQTTFTDTYTSFPPAGTLKNDVVLTTGLGVTLSRK